MEKRLSKRNETFFYYSNNKVKEFIDWVICYKAQQMKDAYCYKIELPAGTEVIERGNGLVVLELAIATKISYIGRLQARPDWLNVLDKVDYNPQRKNSSRRKNVR